MMCRKTPLYFLPQVLDAELQILGQENRCSVPRLFSLFLPGVHMFVLELLSNKRTGTAEKIKNTEG